MFQSAPADAPASDAFPQDGGPPAARLREPGDPHFVLVGRRSRLTSPSLPSDVVGEIEAAFRSGPWYRDRWARPKFRAVMERLRQGAAPGGLMVLGPRVGFDPPPPFDEFFEPIRLSRWDFGNSVQLKTLSGSRPTRQERFGRVARVIIMLLVAGAVCGGAWSFYATHSLRPIAILISILAAIGVIVAFILWLTRLGGTWYLVPSGVAIVRPLARAGQRLVVRTRAECDLLLRWVHTGKASFLVAELRERGGRNWRQAVTDRQALSLLAAWQSRHRPPAMEQLREVLGVSA